MSVKFLYSTGTYERPLDLDDDQTIHAIQQDAQAELVALRDFADLDNGGAATRLGDSYEPIVVADFPPSHDERWAKVDALPASTLRGFYLEASTHLTQAAALPLDSPEQQAARRSYYRVYRLHLLARFRRPLDFISA